MQLVMPVAGIQTHNLSSQLHRGSLEAALTIFLSF